MFWPRPSSGDVGAFVLPNVASKQIYRRGVYLHTILFIGKFSNGAILCTFRTHINCAKIRTYKNFSPENTQFFIAWQLVTYYDAPDVPVNMVAAYHCLDGERSMHHESKSSN